MSSSGINQITDLKQKKNRQEETSEKKAAVKMNGVVPDQTKEGVKHNNTKKQSN